MPETRDSKEYSWKWVIADELLSHGACDLLHARAYSSGNAIENTAIYDGEDTNGKLIVNFNSGVKGNIPLTPKVPIYCRRGLYVDIGDNVEGVFVQWRELGHKG